MFRVISSIRPAGLSNIFCAESNRGPGNCIDKTSTGASFYDSFLDDKYTDYLAKAKNLQGRIEYLTPREYYAACAEIFHSTVNRLVEQRQNDLESIDWLSKRLDAGQKFHLPYVNYANEGQEGLHRMLVLANKYGWDTYTFPVLVIRYVDEHRVVIDNAYETLNRAIDESLQYKYLDSNLPDDLITEIQWNLDSNEDNQYTAKCYSETSEDYLITLVGFESDISIDVSKSSIKIKSSDDFDISDEDLDIDDVDLDELLKSL